MSNGTTDDAAAPAERRAIVSVYYFNQVVEYVVFLDDEGPAGGSSGLSALWQAIANGWRIVCTEKLLADPAGTTCHLSFLLRLSAAPRPPQEKPFILSVAFKKNGDPVTNLQELRAELAAGWTVACSEPLLANAAMGLSYVLYMLRKA